MTADKPIPQWAGLLFRECLDHLKELEYVLWLSVQGITDYTRGGEFLRWMQQDPQVLNSPDSVRILERVRFTQREVESGFPLLHSQTALLVWSTLEHLVVSYVTETVKHGSPAALPEQIRRLRIRVGDLLDMAADERAVFLINAMESELSSALRRGVSRFESILDPFGLSGEVPENVREALFELQQVRNVHAHRRGKADAKFIEACPWLGCQSGSPVALSAADIQRYLNAAYAYVTALAIRQEILYGRSVPVELEKAARTFAKSTGRRPSEQLTLAAEVYPESAADGDAGAERA